MISPSARRGTKVRIHAGPYAGLSGATDGYATMAGVKRIRVRLYENGEWTTTVYPLPAEVDREE